MPDTNHKRDARSIVFDMEGDICRAKDFAHIAHDRICEAGTIDEEMHNALVAVIGEALHAAKHTQEAYFELFEAMKGEPQ
jgi:hypothetical protein